MGLNGLLIGVVAFVIIGAFHPIVIRCQYHFTDRVWPLFLVVGVAALALSCFVPSILGSAALAIFGCACLWSIHELKEQTRRVRKGWFPGNPRHTATRPQEGRDQGAPGPGK